MHTYIIIIIITTITLTVIITISIIISSSVMCIIVIINIYIYIHLDPTFQPPRVNIESAWHIDFIKIFCKQYVVDVIQECTQNQDSNT